MFVWFARDTRHKCNLINWWPTVYDELLQLRRSQQAILPCEQTNNQKIHGSDDGTTCKLQYQDYVHHLINNHCGIRFTHSLSLKFVWLSLATLVHLLHILYDNLMILIFYSFCKFSLYRISRVQYFYQVYKWFNILTTILVYATKYDTGLHELIPGQWPHTIDGLTDRSWHSVANKTLTSEYLVEEDFDVIHSEWLLGHNDTMKVTLH